MLRGRFRKRPVSVRTDGEYDVWKSDIELPCTGDWVLFQPFDEHKGIIVDMLPRERTLYRKKNGTVADKQAIASYVDKAFIVQSLDDNFNVRRAERFMIQMQEENINPVLVFNKADLGFDKQKVEEQIRHIARQIPVFLQVFINLRRFSNYGSLYRQAKRLCLSALQV